MTAIVLYGIISLLLQDKAIANTGTSMGSPFGNFDSGIIDTSNLIQFKQYDYKPSEENPKKHKHNGQIKLPEKLQKEFDRQFNNKTTDK